MSQTSTEQQPQGDTGDGSGSGGSQSKSLADLLVGLDDEAKSAVLGEVDKARREAAGYRTKVRELEPKAKEHDKLLESQKTAEQQANDKAAAAADRATRATLRAVTAEIKALAANDFADPEDASAFLGDIAKYADEDGEVDVEALRADLASLLARKPHLAKVAGQQPRAPRPDRSQGSSGNGGTAAPTAADAFAGVMNDLLRR